MTMDQPARAARYLDLIRWARARYSVGGVLLLSEGGVLSPYSRIERAAFRRYLEAK